MVYQLPFCLDMDNRADPFCFCYLDYRPWREPIAPEGPQLGSKEATQYTNFFPQEIAPLDKHNSIPTIYIRHVAYLDLTS